MGASGEHRPAPHTTRVSAPAPPTAASLGPAAFSRHLSFALTVRVYRGLGLVLIENVFKLTPALCGGIQKLLLGNSAHTKAAPAFVSMALRRGPHGVLAAGDSARSLRPALASSGQCHVPGSHLDSQSQRRGQSPARAGQKEALSWGRLKAGTGGMWHR